MAKRDKLTKKQKRQIAKTRERKKEKQHQLELPSELGHLHSGLVISRFGEQADVIRLNTGEIYRCYLRQNLGALVPGDRIQFKLDHNQQGVIETVEERNSLLERPSFHQGLKPVVANVDRIFIIVAPLPNFSSILLDRYIVAIEQTGIKLWIVANKNDLVEDYRKQAIDSQLAIYQELGYPVIKVSTQSDVSRTDFINALKNHSSILVGQSGVGKSSIINWVFPEISLNTQSISENSRLGQHTTTASQLFCLNERHPEHGFIIDSPGIREFGLWHLTDQKIAEGYIDFTPYIGACKFRDCNHINEPGCAIIQAVDRRKINLIRWNNYTKIITNNPKNE